MALDGQLEHLLLQAMHSGADGGAAMEPGLAENLSQQAQLAARQQEQMGYTPVLLVPAALRLALAKFLRRVIPDLRVLSHDEIPDSKTIRVTSLIGGQA